MQQIEQKKFAVVPNKLALFIYGFYRKRDKK